MPDQDGDKTQDATPHRRQKAREEGQVAKSQDLGSAVLLLAGMMAFAMSGGALVEFIGEYSEAQLGGEAWLSADNQFAVAVWNRTLIQLARYVLPIFAVMLLVAILVNVAQVGFLFLPSKVAFDISRLDPLKGLKRLFSISSTARLGFGLFKMAVIATVAYVSLYQERSAILGLTGLVLPEVAAFIVNILFWTTVKIGVVLFILAILEYAFQRWKHEQDLKMTSQEVREEMKNLEGDPQIAARRRAVQRQLALNQMGEAVPRADVVITNPTELAVAVQYQPESMAAPVVVAKGAGLLAKRIRRLALEHGIPIVEKKPLAQALYRDVGVNQAIPQDKYAAVAEILAYVYQLKGKDIPESKAA
jgi:flagellar biosynthesis protein FlhB